MRTLVPDSRTGRASPEGESATGSRYRKETPAASGASSDFRLPAVVSKLDAVAAEARLRHPLRSVAFDPRPISTCSKRASSPARA
jgi:hypothetical protein